MKPKKNHKKMWLISAISLILTIILLFSGCLSGTAEIKLLPENSTIPLPIPKLFLLNTSNWWNIIFLLLFIFIFIGIIYFLEIKNKNTEISDFNHYDEEEEPCLKNSFFLGIKIGSIVGLLGILTVIINPVLTRIFTGIIFTSLATLLLIAMYDFGTSIIETPRNRIKNAIGAQTGNTLVFSFLIGISSSFRDGIAAGMGIFLTVFLFSIIITLTITTIVIIIIKTRKRIIKFFFYRK